MATKYEQSIQCLINFKASRGWRETAHAKAKANNQTLSAYIKTLVDLDDSQSEWQTIADDLYAELAKHEQPIPQTVINAMARYERRKQARW